MKKILFEDQSVCFIICLPLTWVFFFFVDTYNLCVQQRGKMQSKSLISDLFLSS